MKEKTFNCDTIISSYVLTVNAIQLLYLNYVIGIDIPTDNTTLQSNNGIFYYCLKRKFKWPLYDIDFSKIIFYYKPSS